ncbi:MAG: TonB-dependent receptor [Lewinellaceae bacterium]|nr:TonB-dependent receptor [Lewinellaceae bacterium]
MVCFCCIAISNSAFAQGLRGRVVDADNGAGVTGATLSIIPSFKGADNFYLATSPGGDFLFESLAPGYYRLDVDMLGYEKISIQELLVAAGKEDFLEIALRKSATTLPDVTIKSSLLGRRLQQELGEIPLSHDQTLRFPAMSFDPARLATAYPGVAQTDDGINGLSIRGNSPAAVKWRLEGVEIVNPNHLPNAGTFSDGPAAASGGILMFSAQLLDNSRLLTGSFAPGYGDASAGIMDMYLRPGNNQNREFTVQAGLIGLDAAAEGPISKEKGSSYLANYRYSTVGLLSQMGVSFGDEAINFQDLSFNLRFPLKSGGYIGLFGMGGLSVNDYQHTTDSTALESYKQFFDINFESRSGLIGLTEFNPLGKSAWVKSTLLVSGQKNERRVEPFNPDFEVNARSSSAESNLSGSSTYALEVDPQNRLLAGHQFSFRQYEGMVEQAGFTQYRGDTKKFYFSWQPWASWEWNSRSDKTQITAGLHTLWATFNAATAVDPRVSLRHRISQKQKLSASWGIVSSTQPIWLYAGLDASNERQPNKSLGLTHTQQAALRYGWQSNPNLVLSAEIFWQHHTKVPVFEGDSNGYSLYNDVENLFSSTKLINGGKARNVGLELGAERRVENGFFWLANATLFQSQYTGSDGIWRDSRWNLGKVANVVLGKEWQREKEDGLYKTFGVNGRAVFSGGFYDLPVNELKNPFNPAPYPGSNTVYSEQLPDYFRLDLRVYWKRHLGNRRNSTFAMEFQNVTLQQNVAYYYFDPFTNQTETKYQLGLIPFISWRLEF